MTKNLTHVAAWLLAFALWGVGYYMLDQSAFWLLLCFAGCVVGLIAGLIHEHSPPLSEEEKHQVYMAAKRRLHPGFVG